MQEVVKLSFGVAILILGFFIGNYLAKKTKEELKPGQKWFRLLIILSGIGVIVSLYIRDDVLLFTLLFIIIITSRSLRKAKR